MLGNLLSHYRIVEQIGAGGMGIVYRAHDEQLDRDVAIKVLPPGSLTDEAARKRFRKEALSLARLNHPNIATAHEFGTEGGVDFLVTEYIPGITLDVKLARGPLLPGEVTKLGLQLAAGLEAAHQQSIVHRDLKPGNLRLTTDGRLKILDFGLSQFMPHAGSLGMTATLTQSQETSGTLPYMAPELLSGEMADARTDLWAAGAVLYEMSTGKRPFPQTVPGLLINAILNQSPEPPDKVNPAVPANLNVVILKSLERDRARRYQTASELARDLENLQSAVTVSLPIRQTKSSARIFGIGVLVVVLLSGGFFAYRHRKSSGVAGGPRRRSVAVLGFKNLSASPEKAWLSTAISEMLTTELSQGDQLRTIPGESVALMKASLSLPDADSFGQQTLHRIRQNLGSDDVVLGSYVPLGSGQLRLDVRLQDTAAGVTLASVSEKGMETEIDSLVSQVGQELRGKLGVSALSDTESAAVRASLPSNPEAARLYSQGLQKLRVFDALGARDALEKAAQLVPDHAPTHAALAEAYSRLGYEDKAKDQAKQALALSSNASREERLLIEARAHELSGENGQVVDNYKTLWDFFPDNIDYGLFLIRAQLTSGHPADAEMTLTELRKRAVSEVDIARVEMADASIAGMLGDFKREQAAAQQAEAKGRSAGANLLVAQALQTQAQAEERMGQSKSTVEHLNQAKQLFDSAGDRRGSARVVLNVGDLLYDQGDYEGAKQQFTAALPVFREIGARKSIRATLERIGNVLYSEGKMPEAKDYYEQSLALDREGSDSTAFASDYGNIANTLDSMGDLKGALKMQQQALAAFEAVGDKRGAGATLNNLGILFVEMGDLDEAQKYYDQALAMARESSYHRGEPDPISGTGDVLLARGDLAGAKRRYEQALAMCQEMKEEDSVAQLNTSLAMVALADKRYSDGERLAQEGASGYAKVNSAVNEGWARAILARNLLAEGKVPEAEASAAKAVQLATQGVALTPRYEAVLADSRVKARSGKVAEARRELETSIASARKFGYRLYEYQLRLALGEIELSARVPSARPQLQAVAKDANAHGALLVARQAGEFQNLRVANSK